MAEPSVSVVMPLTGMPSADGRLAVTVSFGTPTNLARAALLELLRNEGLGALQLAAFDRRWDDRPNFRRHSYTFKTAVKTAELSGLVESAWRLQAANRTVHLDSLAVERVLAAPDGAITTAGARRQAALLAEVIGYGLGAFRSLRAVQPAPSGAILPIRSGNLLPVERLSPILVSEIAADRSPIPAVQAEFSLAGPR